MESAIESVLPAAVMLTGQNGKQRRITLSETLRHLPGRRKVCRGTLDGIPVVVKLFPSHRRAERDWRRELAGLEALGPGGPELLDSGKLSEQPTCARVVVTREIAPATTLRSLESAGSGLDPAVVESLVRLVARLHKAGTRLLDPHLDNFLLTDDGSLRCVDGGAVRATQRAVPMRTAWRELGLVIAQLQFGSGLDVGSVAQTYAALRGGAPHAVRLARECARWRRIRWRRYRRKIFRDCSEFVTVTSSRQRQVLRRDLDSPAFRKLLNDIDQRLMGPESMFLKQGNSATVAKIVTDAGPMVVKRYNIKGVGHYLRRVGRPSRAAAAWRAGYFMRLFGLPTPEPCALVEPRPRRLPGTGYLVSRYRDGVPSSERFAELPWSDATRRAAHKVKGLFIAMQALGFSHGDLKSSNLLVENGEVWVLDLEGMCWHRSPRALARALARDRRRFLGNWSEAVAAQFVRTLAAADEAERA